MLSANFKTKTIAAASRGFLAAARFLFPSATMNAAWHISGVWRVQKQCSNVEITLVL